MLPHKVYPDSFPEVEAIVRKLGEPRQVEEYYAEGEKICKELCKIAPKLKFKSMLGIRCLHLLVTHEGTTAMETIPLMYTQGYSQDSRKILQLATNLVQAWSVRYFLQGNNNAAT